MRVAAQTILWGESIRDNMADIVACLARLGYEGVETGGRHFDLVSPEYYRDLYARYNIEPVAIHSGGTFWDSAQAARDMENNSRLIEFACEVGFRFFVMSGNRTETAETMKKSAEFYNRIAASCQEAGLIFAYHNHKWEFADDAVVLNALLSNTDRSLVHLVPDTAWILRAGYCPAKAIEQHKDRIAYLHLKDILGQDLCELGRGEVDFDSIFALLPHLSIDWLAVEQDETSRTPQESLAISFEYLREKGVISTYS